METDTQTVQALVQATSPLGHLTEAVLTIWRDSAALGKGTYGEHHRQKDEYDFSFHSN
jgi:hypothetical protein